MTLMQSEGLIEVADQQEMLAVLGRNDELLRVIQDCYDAKIVARGNTIAFSGDENEVKQLESLFKELLFLERQGAAITTHDVRYSIRMIAEAQLDALHRMYADTIIVTRRGRQVKAKTLGQWNYIDGSGTTSTLSAAMRLPLASALRARAKRIWLLPLR